MTFSDQVIQIINTLCDKFGIAIDLASDNVVPYLKELCLKFIKYEIWTSVFWIVISISFCGIFWIAFLSTKKKANEINFDVSYFVSWVNVGSCIIATISSVVAFLVMGREIYDIIEAVTFPEKVILEYLSKITNGNS